MADGPLFVVLAAGLWISTERGGPPAQDGRCVFWLACKDAGAPERRTEAPAVLARDALELGVPIVKPRFGRDAAVDRVDAVPLFRNGFSLRHQRTF